MKSLDTIRAKIDEIDGEMRVLFEKRMDCIKEVIEYKYNNDDEIFDQSREEAVIEKNLNQLENLEYSTIYQDFLQVLMDSSKAYQKEWIKSRDAEH